MKRLTTLLLLFTTPLFAETVIVKESTMLKAERSVISLKAGTEVELVARDADTVTIKYHNLTGKIPASKLEGEVKTAEAPKAEEKKPVAAAVKPPAGDKPAPPAARPPQTTYGKAVQKARDNAAAHDKNVAKPADEVLKE